MGWNQEHGDDGQYRNDTGREGARPLPEVRPKAENEKIRYGQGQETKRLDIGAGWFTWFRQTQIGITEGITLRDGGEGWRLTERPS